MKKFYILFIVFLISCSSFAGTIVIDGKAYSIDTVANFKVGPGTYCTAVELNGAKRLNVFFLKVDLTNPYVSFKSIMARDSIYGTERPSAMAIRKSKDESVYFAGTNGDFYDTGTTYNGMPTGGSMVENQIGTMPINYPVMAVDNHKTPYIGIMTFSGSVSKNENNFTINHVNHIRNTNELVLYNSLNGKYTHTNAYGTEILIQLLDGESIGVNKTVKGKVSKIETNKGNMAIPVGNMVLSGHGTAQTFLNTLALNDEVNITQNVLIDGVSNPYSDIVGGDHRTMMLKNGAPTTDQIWNELHPRTAFGYSQDKNTAFQCVVDGRGISAGVTTKELAELMLSAGAYEAINLDGGGSSCLYVKDFGPMNTPSDGTERAVANGVFIVSNAPADNAIAEIKNIKQKVRLPRYGIYSPLFYGYNQYGMLISKNVTNVVLSVDPEVGEILPDGRFFASGSKNGNITANFKGIKTTFDVELIPEAPVKIRLDTVLLDNHVLYPIEVQATVDETQMELYPNALTWEVKNSLVCSINNGVLQGINSGSSIVIGVLGAFKDSMLVNVEIPDKRYVTAKSLIDPSWSIMASSNLTNVLNSGSDDDVVTSFIYNAGRSTNIAYTNDFAFYSLPDSFKLKFNPGDISISKIILRFKENNSGTNTINKEYTGFVKNADNIISIAIPDILSNPNDRSGYPIHFNFMKVLIDGVGMNAAQIYNFEIKDFKLVYNSIQSRVEKNQFNDGAFVYPNPFENEIHVFFKDHPKNQLNLKLYDMDGKVIKSWYDLNQNFKELKISVPNLQKGVYFLEINNGNNYKETCKLIKR